MTERNVRHSGPGGPNVRHSAWQRTDPPGPGLVRVHLAGGPLDGEVRDVPADVAATGTVSFPVASRPLTVSSFDPAEDLRGVIDPGWEPHEYRVTALGVRYVGRSAYAEARHVRGPAR